MQVDAVYSPLAMVGILPTFATKFDEDKTHPLPQQTNLANNAHPDPALLNDQRVDRVAPPDPVGGNGFSWDFRLQ